MSFLFGFAASASGIATGKSRVVLEVNGAPLEVYTYRPERYAGGAFVLVLHGVGRNAADYRDYATALAEQQGLLIVAPLFDTERFPTWRYQWGGVVSPSNLGASGTFEVEAHDKWIGRILLGVANGVRALEGAPELPYYLLGHSAGAQALTRVAALMKTDARRIVVANAGTYLWPSFRTRFPDGYGGLPKPLGSEAALRAYLAQPLTLLLGTADVGQDAQLSMRDTARAQGLHRYERGLNAYRAAQRLAHERGWRFNWKLIEVPGVGHSASRMLRSDGASAALQP